jgi:Rps23 Pro-64 3,4-dihydroxylase Tpa1-like proline 4-hydroxylase
LLLDEFLVAQELRGLVDFTFGRRPDFVGTQVISSDGENHQDYQIRRSRVLFDLGIYHQVFVDRLITFFPYVLARLGHPWFPVSQTEVQLTATNNGEYFRMHTDSGSTPVQCRAITFVYFFHREPRGFGGGELLIHDTDSAGGQAVPAGPYRVVHPLQNQIVFFPSDCLHEILPVDCRSGAFEDSRFTVNGWWHR